MIRNIHVQQLREHVEQAERDLAGWRFLLGQAEQGEHAGTVLPDPLNAAPRHGWSLPDLMPNPGMVDGQPWPQPPGRAPYPTSLLPIDGSTLPPKQETALDTIASEHAAYAQTAKAREEEKEWRQA